MAIVIEDEIDLPRGERRRVMWMSAGEVLAHFGLPDNLPSKEADAVVENYLGFDFVHVDELERPHRPRGKSGGRRARRMHW